MCHKEIQRRESASIHPSRWVQRWFYILTDHPILEVFVEKGPTRRTVVAVCAVLGLVAMVIAVAWATTQEDGAGRADGDAGVLLDRALADHVAGRIDEARDGYEAVVAVDPDNSYALYNLGLIAQTEGDSDAAEDFYRRCLAIEPDFEAALFNLAIIRAQQGDTDEAISLYKRTIDVNGKAAGAHLNLGFLYLELGQEKKGNAEIQRAIELDPSLADRISVPEEGPKETPNASPTG